MITHSPLQTRAFGERLAHQLQAGDVLILHGDLGAGKSELTRGIARGLGVTETVTSPSFTIMNLYESGRIPLCHFDWYRLQGSGELWEMGMEEYLGGEDVAVVEWPSCCPEAVPECALHITLTPLDDTTRRITLEPAGGFRTVRLEENDDEAACD